MPWSSNGTLRNTLAIGESTGCLSRKPANCFTGAVDYLEIFDETHSEEEERFIAVGPIRRGVIVVVHNEPREQTIRIISARPATKAEIVRYRGYWERV